MRKVLASVLAVVGLVLLSSSTEAKPKIKRASAAPAAPAASGSSAAPAPPAATPTDTAKPEGEWSLQDTKYWANLQEEMDANIKRANTQCGGTVIKGTFDKESFRGHLTEGGSYGMNSYARAHCAAGPSAIENICTLVNDDVAMQKASRAAVKAKVVTIECRWGGKGKQAITFANKKLTTTIDIDGDDNAASLTTKVTDFMQQKL